jgi:hypothetical protein
MVKKNNIAPAIALALACCLALTGCGGSLFGGDRPSVYDEKGRLVSVDIKEISLDRKALYAPISETEAALPLPVSVLVGEREVFESGNGADAMGGEATQQRELGEFKWFTATGHTEDGTPLDMENFIPVIDYEKRPLIAVLPTEEDVLAQIYATPIMMVGYTLGCGFYVSSDEQTLYLDTSSLVAGSSMEQAVVANGMKGETVKVASINGETVLPTAAVDTEIGFMRGLAKAGRYRLKVYRGSKTAVFDVLADTLVFEEDFTTKPVGLKYTMTESGYYFVNTSSLERGKYYLIEPFSDLIYTFAGDAGKKPAADEPTDAGQPAASDGAVDAAQPQEEATQTPAEEPKATPTAIEGEPAATDAATSAGGTDVPPDAGISLE